jgi:hypothetical protein
MRGALWQWKEGVQKSVINAGAKIPSGAIGRGALICNELRTPAPPMGDPLHRPRKKKKQTPASLGSYLAESFGFRLRLIIATSA